MKKELNDKLKNYLRTEAEIPIPQKILASAQFN